MSTATIHSINRRPPIVLDDQLLEALPAAVYVCDLNGVVVRYNKRAAELWGRSPVPGDANELYCGSHRLYLSDGTLMPHNQTPMVEAMRSGTSFRNLDVQVEKPDGTRIWILVSIDPLRDANGAIIGAINCFQDVTDHKLAQDRKLQIEELQHRLKNVFATVRSLASQTLKDVADANAAEALDDRLQALFHAHELLARGNWERVDLGDLVQQVAEPFCSGRLRYSGPRVEITPELGVSFALTIQELATNAIKYGALSKPGGSINLTWEVTGEEGSHAVTIHWAETTSFPVREPSRRGFGTMLIQQLLTQHRGNVRISYAPEGVRCDITLPM
jgi:PAS domain S-box-containing protein